MAAIQMSNLTKKYGQSIALNGVDLDIEAGEVFGLLGSGGAGKSTVVRLLSGIEQPTLGDSTVLGLSCRREAEKLHCTVGVVTGTAACYGNRSALENLSFFGSLYGMTQAAVRRRAELLLKELDLWDMRGVQAEKLLPGARRRLSFARAMMHEPKALLLDEPFTALDAESATAMRGALMRAVREEGVTVLMATHRFRDAEALCTRFGVLEGGLLHAVGSVAELCTAAGCNAVARVRIAEGSPVPEGFSESGTYFEREIKAEGEMPKLLAALIEGGVQVLEATVQSPSLAAAFDGLTHRAAEKREALHE